MKGYLGDLLKYLPNKLIPSLLGFITLPILTRLFSPQEFGEYSISLATISVLTILVTWVNQSNIRFYPFYLKAGRHDEYIMNNLLLGIISIFISSILYLAVLTFLKQYLSSTLHKLLLIACLSFILTSFFLILQNFLRVQRKVLTFSTFTVLYKSLSFSLGLLLVYALTKDIAMMLWGGILALLLLIPFVFNYSIKIKSYKLKISGEITKELLKYGMPLVVSNLAAWILTLSSRFQLSLIKNNSDVGIYSAGTSVADHSILLISQLILLASFPIGVKIFESKGAKAVGLYEEKVTGIYLLLAVPAVLGFILVSKTFFSVFFGAEFYSGYIIIPFVVLGSLFFGLQQRFQVGLLYMKQTKYITRSTVIAGIVNVLINFVLIHKYSYLGAAIGNSLSFLLLLILIIYYSSKFFRWPFPFRLLKFTLLGTGIMALSIFALEIITIQSNMIKLLAQITVGLISYTLAIFLLMPKSIYKSFKDLME